MPIDLTDKIVALLVHLAPGDIEALSPARRRWLADHCRRVINLANRADRVGVNRPGVLAQLRDGRQE